MDFREAKHKDHSSYDVIVVMLDGHVRGPFKKAGKKSAAQVAEEWAKKQDEPVSHAKPLIPQTEKNYTAPTE